MLGRLRLERSLENDTLDGFRNDSEGGESRLKVALDFRQSSAYPERVRGRKKDDRR